MIQLHVPRLMNKSYQETDDLKLLILKKNTSKLNNSKEEQGHQHVSFKEQCLDLSPMHVIKAHVKHKYLQS